MFNINHEIELKKRRTFAIISHPDAGKTTITEKMLLLGNIVRDSRQNTGKKNKKYTKSDWMSIEKKRGISVTTSVMQFTYRNILMNLLDTPGHEDFSEDTYRILTAVDCCLLVIDAAKGIEIRTKNLINVARTHNIPVITFINKLDRDSREPISILDEIEKELKFLCTPITWPISCGKNFQGVYHIYENVIHKYKNIYQNNTGSCPLNKYSDFFDMLSKHCIDKNLSDSIGKELELIVNIYPKFNKKEFLKGIVTPVFFGSALSNFGIDHILSSLIEWAPSPLHRKSNKRIIQPEEKHFSGFIFKIQANMNLKHRDRIAFMRIVSGQYKQGITLRHVRTKKNISISNAVSFIAGDRFLVEKAYPGDIIGIHNYGTINIGDTFTQGEEIQFLGIPSFASEIFRKINLRYPIKHKQFLKGLMQLSEEGTVQFFRPLENNNIILGAIGSLQFDVVTERLKTEYNIDAICTQVSVVIARWIRAKDSKILAKFVKCYRPYLAYDSFNNLIYLAPSFANFKIVTEENINISFDNVREHYSLQNI
ncbi:MAG: peptide chain release factor 3 [Buchnera aphidicola (Pentalonia nigronervosa)]|uniref:Peptide chain release factor 3 n=1 Tax=Buchnera aphidicola (Pentalonia nigronervosa) TaxID=1309793 RepID=A0A7H1AZ11_9GAMM|nr:MAG: peptide chain release factor 3 [Buchnera aphidicola (Pentalonia nigronervosa)]